MKNKRKKIDKVKKTSMGSFLLEKAINKKTKGELVEQTSPFEISYNKILSETHSKRVLQIIELPKYVKAGYLEVLRIKMLSNFKSITNNLKIYINESNFFYREDTYSKDVTHRERGFRNQYALLHAEHSKKQAKMITGTSIRTTSRDELDGMQVRMERLIRKVLSYGHIKSRLKSGEASLKSFLFIEVCGDTPQLTDSVMESLIDELEIKGFKFKEVTDLFQYMKLFGPSSLPHSSIPQNWDIQPMTTLTGLSSSSQTFSEGIIRVDNGDVYIGTSINTNYPICVSFSANQRANHTLLVAGTGAGKTTFIKSLALNCMNHRGASYNQIITDYKGKEFEPLKQILGDKCSIITQDISNPVFVNTFQIPDYKMVGMDKPEDAFILSEAYTVNLLRMMVGDTTKATQQQITSVCNDIVSYAYLINGIRKDTPSTYILSRGLNFRSTLNDAINKIVSDRDMIMRYGKDVLSAVNLSLEMYFSRNGSKAYMFNNEISFDKLLNSKVIIFDFGEQTAGGSVVQTPTDINLKVLQKNFISTLYAYKNKLKGEFTLEYEEEAQRQLENPLMKKELMDKVTGGRSLNRTVFIIVNTISKLFDREDSEASAIRENIPNLIIGKCKDEVIEEALNYYGLSILQDELKRKLNSINYKNVFFSSHESANEQVRYLMRVNIPKYWEEHPLFISRGVEKTTMKGVN